MRIASAMIVLASFFLIAPVGGVEEGTCDLKSVEKVFCCEEHDILLPGQLVSGVTYYACADCEEIHKSAGKCDSCDEPLVKKVSGKGVCPHCFAKPEAAEACVKIYYVCSDCGHESLTAGKCEDCEEPWEKQTSRVLVEYSCSECGHTSLQPGKCPEEDCENAGKPLVRTCSDSGTFPHTTPKK